MPGYPPVPPRSARGGRARSRVCPLRLRAGGTARCGPRLLRGFGAAHYPSLRALHAEPEGLPHTRGARRCYAHPGDASRTATDPPNGRVPGPRRRRLQARTGGHEAGSPMSRISVIGNVNIDLLVWPVTELPPPGADMPVESIKIRAAGSAGNTALALANLGCIPYLVGCVGEDHFGRLILRELAAAGIEEGVIVVPEESTGISIAFEGPGRDRSFVTLSGSLEAFRASMVPPEALARDFVLLCGYFSLPSLRGEPGVQLLERVRAAGGCTLFDCDWDPAGWTQESREEVAEILPLVDVFLPSEDEARGLTGLDDPLAAARALQHISGRRVIT